MKNSILIILILFSLPIMAQTKDIKPIYKQLDNEIQKWDSYRQKRQAKADSLHKIFMVENRQMQWYSACEQLVDVYDGFQNDSALNYLAKLANTASYIPDSSYINKCRIRYASLLGKSGMYYTAFEFISKVDTLTLDRKGKISYFRTLEALYEDLAGYTFLWFKKDEYKEKEHQARQRLFALLDKGSADYLVYKSYDLFMKERYEDSYRVAMQCLKKAQPQTWAYDRITFYLRYICDNINRHNEGTYWMALSSLSEIRQGLRFQLGLWTLAERMGDDDLERAYNYITFSSDVVSQCGSLLQTQFVLPVMTTLAKEHSARANARQKEQIAFIFILSALSLTLIIVLWYVMRQRKRLAEAGKKLRETNTKLEETNSQLEDANRVKESYIISFFDICAGYIDQMDQNRKDSGRLLRKGETAKLQKMLSSTNFTQKELKGLYDHFDDVFLGLYPTFIQDFNALIREDARIKVLKKAKMNTPLRIFALMRLGIEQPAAVANFLHCSSTTVYNYRVQLKNAYIGNRDDFEEDVKRIGLR